MGSGKTTIGAALATALGYPFLDNDTELERRTGCTAAEIEARDGIGGLHEAEAEVLLETLRAPRTVVVAAAASTIVDPAVRSALAREPLVVWLRADPEVLAARLPGSGTRPFASEAPEVLVARQSRERDERFRDVADLVVDTGRSTPADAVAAIVERVPRPIDHAR